MFEMKNVCVKVNKTKPEGDGIQRLNEEEGITIEKNGNNKLT